METSSHHHSSLLVVLGDHGMNDGGNHGGSSAGEVSTALMFISPSFISAFEGVQCPLTGVDDFKYYEAVEQSDIAPTLASLLGFPIPRNNLGVVIPRLLELWTTDSDKFDILYENALQIYDIAIASFPQTLLSPEKMGLYCDDSDLSNESQLACAWSRLEHATTELHKGQKGYHDAIDAARDFLKLAQEVLSGTASNYDLFKMRTGIALTSFACVLALTGGWSSLRESRLEGAAYVVLAGAYATTMFASSYVEEEQQFWCWILGAWFTILHFRRSRLLASVSWAEAGVMALVTLLFGVTRRWNQTGQKYAGSPDLVSEVFSRHTWLLWFLVVGTYAVMSRSLSRQARLWCASASMSVLPVAICIAAITFKITFTAADAPELLEGLTLLAPLLDLTSQFSLLSLARVAFLGILLMLACAFYFVRPWKSSENRETSSLLHFTIY